MDEKIRCKVFEPFFTSKPVGKVTGLGHSTAYGIIRLHWGCVDVLSRPGMGSTFRVFLPAVQAGVETVTSVVSPVNPEVSFTGALLLADRWHSMSFSFKDPVILSDSRKIFMKVLKLAETSFIFTES